MNRGLANKKLEVCVIMYSFLQETSNFFQLIFIFVSIFLIERYIFLEVGMTGRKQRWFYIAAFVMILSTYVNFSEDAAGILAVILGGLNISLARKTHRIRGFFLVIPVDGIINGLAVPIWVILPKVIFNTKEQAIIYSNIVYLIMFALLILFYVKGKRWRMTYQREAKNRHLEVWELTILCIVGVLFIFYANVYNMIDGVNSETSTLGEDATVFFDMSAWGLTAMTAFVLTITVIVLIVQGNKRSYYYRKAFKMHKVKAELDKAEASSEAKTRFLSTMSHEIRTPMNVIVGMTDILLREEHSEQTREYLNSIKSSGDALLTIINDILDFSKIESGKLAIVEEEYEPFVMLDELKLIFENQAKDKDIELIYDIDKNMPLKLKGDSKRVRQIIINLMNNAIKFTDKGYVKLTVEKSIVNKKKVDLTFTVEDTGQGIKEEDVGKLFESFEQVDIRRNHHKEGSGLGLVICKQLVDLMGGSIGVESRYGEGSKFYFKISQKILKIDSTRVEKSNKKTENYKSFIAPKAKVLIVDDNQMNLKVAIGLLAPLKLQIDTAYNGEEAVRRVQDKDYDIVFMDHMMPVMDGVESTKQIRLLEEGKYTNLPIIALSANATKEARDMFIYEGLNDFVAKPIVYDDICQCIYKWLPKKLIEIVEDDKLKTGRSEKKVEVMSILPNIEGIDISEGIKNCGSKELFFELLGDFYKLIDSKSEKLETCLEKDLIRDYTIEVHALKNTARMIGAMELSDYFYKMEKLGNAGDKLTIMEKTPGLLKMYRRYKNILAKYAVNTEDNLEEVSVDKLKEILMKLHDAVDGFDLDTADVAMKELKTYEFPHEMKQMVETLDTYVSDVAMEDVMNLTVEMCNKLDTYEKHKDNKSSTIMIIDDDEINIKAVKNMLQNEFNMLSANSGKEAFELLKKRIPDLILLDVHMPELSGHDVIKVLKEKPEYMDIPVIFLTSDEDENTEIQGFSEGAIDFIRKPFRKSVAIQRIKRILELSYLQNNLKEEVIKQTNVAENRRKKVEKMSWQMVQALANTIDAKDSYTNGHSTRVAKYSVMIAKRMGYEGERLEQLQYAAMLHDIGKIGVPREIINKPSRLTDEEYEIIKTHPDIGANILDEITEIPDIAIGARWHHERFDGKGYPNNLAGSSIPKLARIIGVADAYDAMTSNRSYRDILSQEIVIEELNKGKGCQFDPEIADIMIEIIKEDKDYILHE